MKNLLQTKLHNYFFFLLLGSLILGNLSRFSVFDGAQLYAHDVIILLWILAHFIEKKTTISAVFLSLQKSISTSKLFQTGLILALVLTFVHFLLSFQLFALLYVLRLALYIFFGFSIWNSKLQLPWKSASVLAIAIAAFHGLLQYFLLPDTRFLYVLGYDDHFFRLIGTYLDPAIIGAVLLIGIITTAYTPLIANSKTRVPHLMLFVASITLTMSRASYLGLGFVLLALLLQKKLKLGETLLSILLFCCVLVFVSIGKGSGEGVNLARTASISARIETVEDALPKSLQTAAIGSGLFFQSAPVTTQHDLFTTPNNARVADNFFVFLLSSFGLPVGLLLILGWMQLILLNLKKHPFSATILLTVILLSQFNAIALQPFVVLWVCLVLQNESRVKK